MCFLWCIKDELEYADNGIPLFTLDKKILEAKIVSVYDGDTCFAVFAIHNNTFVKFRIRMQGYDSPEMKPRLDKIDREKEIIKAKKAKEELEKLVLHKIVYLHCGKWDKYGRLLATIYTRDNINVNQYMINNNFGYIYHGGTKQDIQY